MIGRIKHVQATKGYGFLVDEQGVERFFHRTNCIDFVLSATLIGLYADFQPGCRDKGACALHVLLLPDAPPPLAPGPRPAPDSA